MSVTNNVAVLHFLKQRCVTWRHRTGSVILMFLDTTVHRLGNSVALFCFASFSLERFPSVGRRCTWTPRAARLVPEQLDSQRSHAGQTQVRERLSQLSKAIHPKTFSVHAGLSHSLYLSLSQSLSLSLCDRGGFERTHGSLGFLWAWLTEGSPWNRLQVFTLCDPILIAEIEFMYIFIFF